LVRWNGLAAAVGVGALVGITGISLYDTYAADARAPATTPAAQRYELNDVHFHLTNYVQEGTPIDAFVRMLGTTVGRVAIFGIPLQQQWSYRVSGDFAPGYYLDSDAPLYYYSYVDAHLALAYRSLPRAQQERLDPMITGFNVTDMYAADHIRRVLTDFPGVFSGIGEFTIHKEFVSSKVAGEVASLTDPAVDRIFEFAAEVGLVALIHNDMDTPFSKRGSEPVYLEQVTQLFERHPRATIIWAHVGLGRVIAPVERHAARIKELLEDPRLPNLYFDLSWSETAKYLVATPASIQISAELINRHPDRFLFGTDEVAPPDATTYLRVYEQYAPLWSALTPTARDKVKRANYERIFDEARRRVRAWERTQLKAGR
jgi:hypothetical protein